MKVSYECALKSDNYISYIIDNNICTMDNVIMDNDNIKLFFVLLRNSIDDLKSKKCTIFRQNIVMSDWIELNELQCWKLISENKFMNSCLIECDINNALTNIAKSLNINS